MLPAVVEILSGPLAGAIKVLVQVIVPLTVRGLGTGEGVQLWVAPAGRPLKLQVAKVATLGPALVQTPDTVTLCPALALVGTVVSACISACGTTLALA